MSQNIESVCIIDDDNIYINLVSKIIQLRKLSDSILIFKNGKEALDYFEQSLAAGNPVVPQVIFLDLNMPIMDGWQFLSEFSKINDKSIENIDLYVVSSSIDSRDIERARAIDVVSDYIVKPIKPNVFEQILAA